MVKPTLLENIYKLMDFSNYIDKETVLTEFQAKYNKSYILFNNELVFLSEVLNNKIIIDGVECPFNELHTIKQYILKTGIYTIPGRNVLVYIYKYPTRQYSKGVKFGVTHNIRRLAGNQDFYILDATYLGNHTIYKNKVYMFFKTIGELTDRGEIKLNFESLNLRKECIELWPQYSII